MFFFILYKLSIFCTSNQTRERKSKTSHSNPRKSTIIFFSKRAWTCIVFKKIPIHSPLAEVETKTTITDSNRVHLRNVVLASLVTVRFITVMMSHHIIAVPLHCRAGRRGEGEGIFLISGCCLWSLFLIKTFRGGSESKRKKSI